MDIAQEYIKDVDKLAPCPEVALDILSVANEADCSISRLAERIEQDPGLTANMLQLANSAYFGYRQKITSIKDIVVRLGLEAVKILAISGASVGLLGGSHRAYALGRGELWRHSLGVAMLASLIARHCKNLDTAAIYTAGLLHDVGKVVLEHPLRLEAYNLGEEDERSLVMVERRLLHTDHAEVGMALLVKWGVPESVTVPVGLHHGGADPRAGRLGARIVRLANELIHLVEIDPDDPADSFFNVLAYENIREELPRVPGFEENMRLIIDEFLEKYVEAVSVFPL
ncbi:MAG: HDOD domain-containing protein [Thermodesulfobacteriota bacterium]